MSSISSLTEALGAMSASYETSDTVKDVLRQKELVPLIGPFAVGKTALMRAAENLDRKFGRVRSFTTRSRRAGEEDDAYDFLPHSEATLRRILEQPKSTINFDDILSERKILICNFSKGLLGEDTSALFGTTVLAKLQTASL